MDLCLFDNALSLSSTQGDSMPLSPQTSKSKLQRKPIHQAMLLACCLIGAQAQAQEAAMQADRLPQVTVTGNPLRNSDGAQTVQVLHGEALLMRLESTLGETLSATPGVSSSYFGPNASRPIIRGMDGDRIKILNNSLASQDVSALSNDHAVPLDPLAVERIEVLRGPSAIMYGGSAVGGVFPGWQEICFSHVAGDSTERMQSAIGGVGDGYPEQMSFPPEPLVSFWPRHRNVCADQPPPPKAGAVSARTVHPGDRRSGGACLASFFYDPCGAFLFRQNTGALCSGLCGFRHPAVTV
jgi:hypothetical protein